jgi:hypothetical protein
MDIQVSSIQVERKTRKLSFTWTVDPVAEVSYYSGVLIYEKNYNAVRRMSTQYGRKKRLLKYIWKL